MSLQIPPMNCDTLALQTEKDAWATGWKNIKELQEKLDAALAVHTTTIAELNEQKETTAQAGATVHNNSRLQKHCDNGWRNNGKQRR